MITKSTLKNLESAIILALREVSNSAGVTFKFTGGSFTSSHATLKLDVQLNGAVTPEVERWNALAAISGLDVSWLGRSFVQGRHTFTIKGMRKGRAEANVLCSREDGKMFRFTPRYIITVM